MGVDWCGWCCFLEGLLVCGLQRHKFHHVWIVWFSWLFQHLAKSAPVTLPRFIEHALTLWILLVRFPCWHHCHILQGRDNHESSGSKAWCKAWCHGVLLLIVHRFMFESRMDLVACALVVSIIPKTEDVKLERVQAGRGHSLSSVPWQNDGRLKRLLWLQGLETFEVSVRTWVPSSVDRSSSWATRKKLLLAEDISSSPLLPTCDSTCEERRKFWCRKNKRPSVLQHCSTFSLAVSLAVLFSFPLLSTDMNALTWCDVQTEPRWPKC